MWAQGAENDEEQGHCADTPAPRRRYRCRLQSVGDVNRELAKLYREARSNIINVSDASKLANILSTIGRIMADSDLEARIEALEGRGK